MSGAGFAFLLLLQAAIFLPLPGVLFVVAIVGVLAARGASSSAASEWTIAEVPSRLDEEMMCLHPSYVAFHARRAGSGNPNRWRWAARLLVGLNLGLWGIFVLLLLAQAIVGVYVLP